MKHHVTAVLFIVTAAVVALAGQNAAPAPVLPDSLRWASRPDMPGVQGAWVLGSEQGPGTYVLRVKMAKGTRILPHSHPDERYTTVLSGSIRVGFGDSIDEAHTVLIPAGAVYVAPANTPHYVLANDGEAVYQEAGLGLTGTAQVKK